MPRKERSPAYSIVRSTKILFSSTVLPSNYDNPLRSIVTCFLLLVLSSSQSMLVAADDDFISCDIPDDGVVDILILYDARMFNAKALQYTPNYDPVPENVFRPVATWFSKYTAFMIDKNRATVSVCLHGMTNTQGGLECTLLKSMSELKDPMNITVIKKFMTKKFYTEELGNAGKYKGGTLLAGLGQMASSLVPGKASELDPRPDVPNVVFGHINDPTNQIAERYSRTTAGLGTKGVFVTFVVFGPSGLPLSDDPMHKFTQSMRMIVQNKHFGIVNANEPYNFDAFVRVCKTHKGCGEYHSASPCHSPTTSIRAKTCVREMTGGEGSSTCPKRVWDACRDPNLCPIACNSQPWGEWSCSGECGRPKSYRERLFKAGTQPYPSEYCVFVETKDCPPEMVQGGGHMTCPETVTIPPTTPYVPPTTTEPPPFWTGQDMTMIIVIGGITLFILLCLVGFVCVVRSKKKEDEFEELEYSQIMRTLAKAKQMRTGASAYGSMGRGGSGKSPYPYPGAGYSGYGGRGGTGASGYGTGQSGYGRGTGQSGYGGGGTGQSGYGAPGGGRYGQGGYAGGGGTGQSGYGGGGTGQSGYGGRGGGTGQSGYGGGGTGQSGYGGRGGTGQSGYGGGGTGQSGYGQGGGTGQSGYGRGGTGQSGYGQGGTGQSGYGRQGTGQSGYGQLATGQTGRGPYLRR